MPKKIIILLMLICFHVTASHNDDLGEESTKQVASAKTIPSDLQKKIDITEATGYCVLADGTIFRFLCNSGRENWVYGIMTASAAVLFPEALEGPLTNKKWSERIAKGFCAAAILIMPETAIGSYAAAYAVNEAAKYYKIDPFNRAACSYLGGRLGGILTQYLLVPAALSFIENIK